MRLRFERIVRTSDDETGPLRLADDVFVCLSDGRFVFMDLRRNQYLCLNRGHSRAAADLFGRLHGLHGNPPGYPGNTGDTDRCAADAVFAALSNKGLLGNGAPAGNDALLLRLPTVSRSLLPVEKTSGSALRPAHLAAFFRASLAASGKLRWQSMRRCVRKVGARKQKRGGRQAADGGTVRELATIFHRLRPLYGRKHLCLFDSLALLEFLARFDRFPHWVFAVRTAPFAAHCWVQESDCVLNDTVENVRAYTPIMAV